MKKGLSILIAITMIFAFSSSAMAADAACSTCKGTAPKVACPDDQGEAFRPFDFDGNKSGTINEFGRNVNVNINGLCDSEPVKAVFDLCSCPEGCQVRVGNLLGVKMEILTKGVYFAWDYNVTAPTTDGSNPANNILRFSLFPKTGTLACDAGFHNLTGLSSDSGRQFTQVSYYNAGQTARVAPVPRGSVSSVATANKAKVLLVEKPGAYMINTRDTEQGLCQMWIDIPAMIVNPAEYTSDMAGTDIKLRVSAFTETSNIAGLADVPTANSYNFNEMTYVNVKNIVKTVDVFQANSTAAGTPNPGAIVLNDAPAPPAAAGTVLVGADGTVNINRNTDTIGGVYTIIGSINAIDYDNSGSFDIANTTGRNEFTYNATTGLTSNPITLQGVAPAINIAAGIAGTPNAGKRVMGTASGGWLVAAAAPNGIPLAGFAPVIPAGGTPLPAGAVLVPGPFTIQVDNDWDVFSRYLCPTCHTPCSCDVIVAKFCCESNNWGLLYPYFAPDNAESYFWNGLVISNLTNEDGIAKIRIYEEDGDVGEVSVTVKANGFFNELIRNIPDITITNKGTGDTADKIGNSKAYIWVCTNFRSHGFAMLSDQGENGESMGYLPMLYPDPEEKKSNLTCK